MLRRFFIILWRRKEKKKEVEIADINEIEIERSFAFCVWRARPDRPEVSKLADDREGETGEVNCIYIGANQFGQTFQS